MRTTSLVPSGEIRGVLMNGRLANSVIGITEAGACAATVEVAGCAHAAVEVAPANKAARISLIPASPPKKSLEKRMVAQKRVWRNPGPGGRRRGRPPRGGSMGGERREQQQGDDVGDLD